ncbi:type VII secretion protein EsaA [Streptococcus pluranimalium]|uniref:Type VII secretion system accessory factor EsaA n=1 Tax=Streptococcus pluranimalium TaxID=82348 RepID=A0A2L0D3X6_9STRE|nr:type VII secretion protein EsaA [Streptococcus pluranimalium]AUW96340.1 type VII secretion protein EsaA [Streptococcus pluranimalium]
MLKLSKPVKYGVYLLAIFGLLWAIIGLNTTIQHNNEKSRETRLKKENALLNVAIVNEDQPATTHNESYNLGAAYVKSLESDDSQNWSVVSRGSAEAGLKNGTYQLMVIIPSDFSAKILDVNNVNVERATVTYKVNGGGNLQIENNANKLGKDIVSDLTSQLVDMYMASVLSSLYTAQKNVQGVYEVQTGNISSYRDSLLQPTEDFKNVFPSLVASANSSLLANQGLQDSLTSDNDFYNTLMESQKNVETSLQTLMEQRSKSTISNSEFTEALMSMNSETLGTQLTGLIESTKTLQEQLADKIAKVNDQASTSDDIQDAIDAIDNSSDTSASTTESSSSTETSTSSSETTETSSSETPKPENNSALSQARKRIAELQKLIKDQQTILDEKLQKVDSFVDDRLADYYGVTVDELKELTLKDFLNANTAQPLAYTTAAFQNDIDTLVKNSLKEVPATDPATVIGLDRDAQNEITFNTALAASLNVKENEKSAKELENLYNDFETKKTALTTIQAKAIGTANSPEQSLTVTTSNLNVTIDSIDVNGVNTTVPTLIDPSQKNDITVHYSYTSTGTTAPESSTFNLEIGDVSVSKTVDTKKEEEAFRKAELAYQKKVQEVVDAYNHAGTLLATYYSYDTDGNVISLTDQFMNQSAYDLFSSILKENLKIGLASYQQSDASKAALKQQLTDLKTSQDDLAIAMADIQTNNNDLSTQIGDQLTLLDQINRDAQSLLDANNTANDDRSSQDTSLSDISSNLQGLLTTTSTLEATAESTKEQASSVKSVFDNFNKEVENAQTNGNQLSTDASALMTKFDEELKNNGNFIDSFAKVFNNAYQNGVPNDVLLDFLASPVTEKSSSVRATVNAYRPFTWVLLLEMVTLFTAYIFATQKALARLKNRFKINKFLETDWLNTAILSGLALIIGLILGTVSSRSLAVENEYIPMWILLVTFFAFLLVHGQYFIIKNLRVIGMGLNFFMIISFIYLSNAIGTATVLSGFPALMKKVNPLILLENRLSAIFDGTTPPFIYFVFLVFATVLLLLLNIFVTIAYERIASSKEV